MTDRLLREVTREEWLALPTEVCYAKRQVDENGVMGKVRFYEDISTEADDD